MTFKRPTHTKCFILNNAPVTEINYDLASPKATFKLVAQELGPLKKKELLAKVIYLSNDASQRGWIQKDLDPEHLYAPPLLEGDVMRSFGIAQVIESNLDGYAAGEFVSCTQGWSEYVILKRQNIWHKINTSIPLTWNADIVGLTGLTAYFGILRVAALNSSDTIVISGASGATGSMCVQIAKNVVGCKRVIGISGGPEKCRWVESIGADVCVDYKDPNFKQNMKDVLGKGKHCDVFFDGVGGSVLDTMFGLTKQGGTIVACGSISGYNNSANSAVKAWGLVTVRRLQIKGFIVSDFWGEFGKAALDILGWAKDGKIKVDAQTVIDLSDGGFTKIPESWGVLFSEKKSNGKLLTKIGKIEGQARF